MEGVTPRVTTRLEESAFWEGGGETGCSQQVGVEVCSLVSWLFFCGVTAASVKSHDRLGRPVG